MVFYAIVTEQSIGKLFFAGIFPGILPAFLFYLLSYVIVRIKPSLAPRGENATWAERFKIIPRMSVIPIVFPIIIKLGVGPIFFGVFITVMCEIALITPPVGVNTYVAATLGGSEAKMGSIFIWIIPYFLIMILLVLILLLFPDLALWLPKHSA